MNATLQFSPEYLAEDNSAPLMRTCIAFLILETIFIILLYVSRFISSEHKANWSMVLLMTSAYLVCVCKITLGFLFIKIGGAGHHSVALTPATLLTGRKLSVAVQIICPLTTSLSKLSVLCLLDTILGRVSQLYRCIIRGTFVLVLVIMLVQVLIPFANCKPFSKMWQVGVPGTCAFDSEALWRYLSIPNVFTTIIVVCIPLPALYRLNASAGTKLGLVIVLLVCIGGIVAAFIRLKTFLEPEDLRDLSSSKINAFIWTVVESGIYLMAGVILTLRPLAAKVFGNLCHKTMIYRYFRSYTTSRRWSGNVIGVDVLPIEEKENRVDSRGSAEDEKVRPVQEESVPR